MIYSWYIGKTRMLDAEGNYPNVVNISSSLAGIMVE